MSESKVQEEGRPMAMVQPSPQVRGLPSDRRQGRPSRLVRVTLVVAMLPEKSPEIELPERRTLSEQPVLAPARASVAMQETRWTEP